MGSFTLDKTIDINATPNDPNDDFHLTQVDKQSLHSSVLFYSPYLLILGLGQERGRYLFMDSDQKESRSFPFSYPYVHLGLSTLNLDEDTEPFITFVAHVFTSSLGGSRGNFSGTTYALQVGWVFR